MFHSSRKEMADLKKAGRVLTEKPESVQDILEVLRISPSGIMEVSQGLYTKSYLIDDANYSTLTYEEQRAFFLSWNKTINALDIQFKITYFNKLQNMEKNTCTSTKVMCWMKQGKPSMTLLNQNF